MATIWIFGIIGVIIFLRVIWEDLDFRYDLGFTLFSILFVAPFCGVLGALIGFFVAWSLPAKGIEDRQQYKMVSLNDGSSINGRFFLGSGHINEKMVYTFYYETENETYKLKQVSATDAEIKYTTGQPTATRIGIKDDTESWSYWFAIDFYEANWLIEIPEGSIQNNYILDAQ